MASSAPNNNNENPNPNPNNDNNNNDEDSNPNVPNRGRNIRRRQVEGGEEVNPTIMTVGELRRVTRSCTTIVPRYTRSTSGMQMGTPPPSVQDLLTGKRKPKKEKVGTSRNASRSISIERCNGDKIFKNAALRVQRGLQKALPGINITTIKNPREGCFEILDLAGPTTLTSLQGMTSPYTRLKELDTTQLVKDIVRRLENS